MSRDEQKISDLIDSGINEREEFISRIDNLEKENAELLEGFLKETTDKARPLDS